MDYNQAWLQHALPELQVTHNGQHTANDDSLVQSSAGAAGSPPTFDLSDLDLETILGTTSTNTPSSSSSAYYGLQHTYYPHLNSPGPFNAVSYGSQQWASSSTPLPVSSYSTLQGANTGASSSSQQSPSSSSAPAMIIDPSLTHMSVTTLGPTTSTSVQYGQDPSAYSYPSQSQQSTQYQYQHQSHQPTLSINPSYVQSNGSHYPPPPLPRPTSQHQHQQQGTLSPFAMHSPHNTMNNSIGTSSFYGMAPQPPQQTINPTDAEKTPEQKRIELLTEIRPLLTPNSFTGAGAVAKLMDHLGEQTIEPSTRLEILTKMRDNAGNHYFRAWVENDDAMIMTRGWLQEAFGAKDDPQLMDTIMPLLHVIDRLPLTLGTLKASKLGRVIVKLTKEPPAPAIKDMASNLERKWRQLLPPSSDTSKSGDNEMTEDAKSKKRKADAMKAAPPAKKAAVSAAGPSRTVVVKKEVKPLREVKDAKSDSSFFSAPKPKPKLPTFKKAAPAPVKKEPDLNVAQPSSFNPFEDALKYMAKSKRESPATATPPPAPPATVTPAPVAQPGTGKAKKKVKKTVRWAPEDQLEMIQLIERAVYDDDPVDGMHTAHNIRDLERDEGAALHTQIFEEQIDWSEPILIEIPPDIDVTEKGHDSQEKAVQEEREQSALVALYMSPAQIPDSPAEPPSQIPEEQVDESVRMMLTGADVDAIFWSGGMPAVLEPPTATSVAELVGQLASSSGDVLMADASHVSQQLGGFDSGSHVTPEQVQQMLQSLGGLVQPPAGQSGGDQGWGAAGQYSDYPERGGYYDDSRDRRWPEDGYSDRGRGRYRGRGRGRGDGFRSNKRKPCSFFAAGRCRYGDQCDFSHEPVY